MAGLRLGYGLAHPETAGRLRAHRIHHPVNHLSAYAALARIWPCLRVAELGACDARTLTAAVERWLVQQCE